MNRTTMAAALASLAGVAAGIACDKSPAPATEVPASSEPAKPSAGEHACGNHAEGACSGDAEDGDAQAEAATARAFEIAPGKFAEANFQMVKGSKVTIAFTKGSPEVAWDVHSHDHAGGTEIHDQGKGGDGAVEFVAPSDGVFSVLWKNTGSSATPLEATVTLGEGAKIHSWMPAD